MRKLIVILIAVQFFCALATNAFADENDFCEKYNAYVVWNGIKVNCVNKNIIYRFKEDVLQISSLTDIPNADMNIKYIGINDIDDFFVKMEKGYAGCKLVYKKDMVFLSQEAIEYKLQCGNSIGTWKGIFLPTAGYSVYFLGDEDYFPPLESVLDHIELLEDQ